MTQGQIARIEAVPHGAKATVHVKNSADGLTVASVRGLLHAREEGCDRTATPWLVEDFAGCGSTCYLHPGEEVVIVSADAAGLVVSITL